MKILVTGGAGFIGSALCRRLMVEHQVIAFDDFSRGLIQRLPDGIVPFQGDIRDPAAVAAAMRLCDVVFHLAYVQGTQTFYERPRKVIDVALRGIMNVLDECQGKQVFLVSSSEVYQEPPPGFFPTGEDVPLSVPDVTNPRYSYGGGKIASEIAAFAYADAMERLVVIRPHNIYGPDMGNEHVIPQFAVRMREIRRAMMPDAEPPIHGFPIQGSGHETRCFCHIDDCIDAFEILLDRGEDRTVYHVGNPAEEISIGNLAMAIGSKCGLRVKVQPGELPQGSPRRRLPDIGRIEALGFTPKVDLARGLSRTVGWYLNG